MGLRYTCFRKAEHAKWLAYSAESMRLTHRVQTALGLPAVREVWLVTFASSVRRRGCGVRAVGVASPMVTGSVGRLENISREFSCRLAAAGAIVGGPPPAGASRPSRGAGAPSVAWGPAQ